MTSKDGEESWDRLVTALTTHSPGNLLNSEHKDDDAAAMMAFTVSFIRDALERGGSHLMATRQLYVDSYVNMAGGFENHVDA